MKKNVFEFILQLMSTTNPDDFKRLFLKLILDIVPADSVLCAESSPHHGIISTLTYPEHVISSTQGLITHIKDHPLHRYRCTKPTDRSAYKLSDFISQRVLHNKGIYVDYFKPNCIDHQIAFLLPSSIGFAPVALHRQGHTDFSEDDRLLLNKISNYMEPIFNNLKNEQSINIKLEQPHNNQEYIKTDRYGKILEISGTEINRWLLQYLEFSGKINEYFPKKIVNWIKESNGFFEEKALYINKPGSRLMIKHYRLHGEATCFLLFQEQIHLTQKELSIFNYLIDGLSYEDITLKLNGNGNTINTQISNIKKKFGLDKNKIVKIISMYKSGKISTYKKQTP